MSDIATAWAWTVAGSWHSFLSISLLSWDPHTFTQWFSFILFCCHQNALVFRNHFVVVLLSFLLLNFIDKLLLRKYRYHLDLCKNVFGEGVYPDVEITNIYYGGTRIAGMLIYWYFSNSIVVWWLGVLWVVSLISKLQTILLFLVILFAILQ